jgi:hypothetical protein
MKIALRGARRSKPDYIQLIPPSPPCAVMSIARATYCRHVVATTAHHRRRHLLALFAAAG